MPSRPIERGHPSVPISTRLPLPTKEEFEAEAEKEGVSVSQLVRDLVGDYLGRKGGENDTETAA